jgi:hypothetical protein
MQLGEYKGRISREQLVGNIPYSDARSDWRRTNEYPKRTQKHSQLGSRSSPRSPGTDASFSFATVKCKQIQVGGSNGFNFRYEADASETCKFKQELSKELSAHALTVRFPSQ